MNNDEAVANDGPALGSDPFLQGDGTLPYLLRLRETSMPSRALPLSRCPT